MHLFSYTLLSVIDMGSHEVIDHSSKCCVFSEAIYHLNANMVVVLLRKKWWGQSLSTCVFYKLIKLISTYIIHLIQWQVLSFNHPNYPIRYILKTQLFSRTIVFIRVLNVSATCVPLCSLLHYDTGLLYFTKTKCHMHSFTLF